MRSSCGRPARRCRYVDQLLRPGRNDNFSAERQSTTPRSTGGSDTMPFSWTTRLVSVFRCPTGRLGPGGWTRPISWPKGHSITLPGDHLGWATPWPSGCPHADPTNPTESHRAYLNETTPHPHPTGHRPCWAARSALPRPNPEPLQQEIQPPLPTPEARRSGRS